MEKIFSDLTEQKTRLRPYLILNSKGQWEKSGNTGDYDLFTDDQIVTIIKLTDDVYGFKYVHTPNFTLVKCRIEKYK